MMNDLDDLVASASQAFAAAPTPAELENAKARFLGKAGRVTELMKGLGALSHEEKKARGAEINQTKQQIEAALNARRQALADAELEAQLKAEALDVTLPGRQRGMEDGHELRRDGIVDRPLAGQHAGRAGDHEGTHQAHLLVAAGDLGSAGVAGAQHHGAGRQRQRLGRLDGQRAVVQVQRREARVVAAELGMAGQVQHVGRRRLADAFRDLATTALAPTTR
mgnify:CR=1 FL=1